ncbi:ABC transporter permease [Verrucosispora sp. ts21]|uniref:ABC transporter permease subunit n=1 Tax=Verrucosispora sp. ts21 TaxID=2069341 RepID=UPI000C88E61B|nr:ABC transporter permease subunit [Verrucosispora sp. ts21]PMR61931.1 ABC transporter permease [Verrucosispora sp. ts21]
MNLIRAEAERLAARRFVQLMVLLLMLAFVVTAGTTLASSHTPTSAEVAAAEQQAAAERSVMEREHARCLARDRGEGWAHDGNHYLPADCREIDPVVQGWSPTAANYLTDVFTFTQQAEALLYFLVAFLVLFGFLVGASYIGADLNSGGVVNLLLWRPQRLTVLGTKLGTLLGAVLVLSVLASVAYLVTFWVIAQVAGYPGPTDATFWADLAARWGRGVGLVVFATAIGFALATMGRHTAAAVGAVLAYLVVWEMGGRIMMQILDVSRPDQLLLSNYVGAWLAGELRFWDATPCADAFTGYCNGTYPLTWQLALVVLLLCTAGLTTTAFAVFRRRDLI